MTDGPVSVIKPLRVWPALLFAILMVASRFGPELFEDGAAKHWMVAVFGPMLCCLLLAIWWLAASRATWRERVFGFLGLAAGIAAAFALSHPTMRGPAINYLTAPLGFLLFALGAAILKNAAPMKRTGTAVALAAVGFALSLVLRTEGMTGDYKFVFHPRWSQTAEELMLATGSESAAKPIAAARTNALAEAEWPAFRGADRAGRSMAGKISTNWTAETPQLLWKKPVGPGWSSFAVAGEMIFTQDQRGPKETVMSLDAASGREIWKTEFDGRLEDPMGGPGPRATPTLAGDALFAVGGAGAFLKLNARSGEVVWKKELTQAANSKTPMWGFSSSPLVVGSVVVVYGGGAGDKGLLAFDVGSGELKWSAACADNTYTSAQLNNILGEELVVMLTSAGLRLLDPATGKTRLDYEWKIPQYRAVQPLVIGEDTILLPTGMNMGTRAIRVTKSGSGLAAEELWTSRHLKPDFVDLVAFKDHAYGNDGGLMTCIDLKTGERKWKGGRYGKGQLLLLENSAAVLILSEQGKVVLVAADAAEHREVASFQAIEGKTWNHPVLAGDRLFVRNSQEAAAFRVGLKPADVARAEK